MDSEDTKQNTKKRPIKTIFISLIIVIAIVSVALLLMRLFTEDITYISTGDSSTSIESLYCTSDSVNASDSFFDLSDAIAAKQKIKVIFNNRKIREIFYDADIVYNDAGTASIKKDNLYVKYGLFMKDNNKNIETFSHNFSTNKERVEINIYTNADKLIPSLAKIFLIDTNDDNLNGFTQNVLTNLYKSKGFICN